MYLLKNKILRNNWIKNLFQYNNVFTIKFWNTWTLLHFYKQLTCSQRHIIVGVNDSLTVS